MSDLERNLEDLFMADSRSRRIENVTIKPVRSGWLGGAAFIGAVAVAVLVVVVALNTFRPSSDRVATAPSASPTLTSAVTVTPTSSAKQSPPTPSPTPTGLYTNETYKFSVVLPPPYRVSTRAIMGAVSRLRIGRCWCSITGKASRSTSAPGSSASRQVPRSPG